MKLKSKYNVTLEWKGKKKFKDIDKYLSEIPLPEYKIVEHEAGQTDLDEYD